MNDYVIVTDSSADLDQEMVKKLDVQVLPLKFTIRGRTCRDTPDHRDMSSKDFYDLIRAGEMGTTSAVNMQEYLDLFTPILQDGKDILTLAFSSGLSSTCQAARMAAEELVEKFPERKIRVVDTLCASLGQGLLVWYAAQKRLAGESLEAVGDWCEENKLHLCHWFTVDDLMHLKRGGRISAATALAGTMLQIKPVLHMDNEGHLISVSKARGRKAALDALADKVGELGIRPEEQTMFICHSDCLEDAHHVADRVGEKYGTKEFYFNDIGPVIGSHTGCGCVSIFFLGEHR